MHTQLSTSNSTRLLQVTNYGVITSVFIFAQKSNPEGNVRKKSTLKGI